MCLSPLLIYSTYINEVKVPIFTSIGNFSSHSAEVIHVYC